MLNLIMKSIKLYLSTDLAHLSLSALSSINHRHHPILVLIRSKEFHTRQSGPRHTKSTEQRNLNNHLWTADRQGTCKWSQPSGWFEGTRFVRSFVSKHDQSDRLCYA